MCRQVLHNLLVSSPDGVQADVIHISTIRCALFASFRRSPKQVILDTDRSYLIARHVAYTLSIFLSSVAIAMATSNLGFVVSDPLDLSPSAHPSTQPES